VRCSPLGPPRVATPRRELLQGFRVSCDLVWDAPPFGTTLAMPVHPADHVVLADRCANRAAVVVMGLPLRLRMQRFGRGSVMASSANVSGPCDAWVDRRRA
jgi:hypothetical protein